MKREKAAAKKSPVRSENTRCRFPTAPQPAGNHSVSPNAPRAHPQPSIAGSRCHRRVLGAARPPVPTARRQHDWYPLQPSQKPLIPQAGGTAIRNPKLGLGWVFVGLLGFLVGL